VNEAEIVISIISYIHDNDKSVLRAVEAFNTRQVELVRYFGIGKCI
jgi:hypothetical protein